VKNSLAVLVAVNMKRREEKRREEKRFRKH
jgi:hypothetical protein